MRRLIVAGAIAIACLGAAHADDAPVDDRVARACEPGILGRAARALPTEVPALRAGIERAQQEVLAEERRVDQPPPRARALGVAGVAGALALVGVALVLVAGRRGRRGASALGVALVTLAVVGYAPARTLLHVDGPDPQALLRLSRCRLMLAEARGALAQSQYSHCVADLGEVDEDLLSMERLATQGKLIPAATITNLRKEIKPQ